MLTTLSEKTLVLNVYILVLQKAHVPSCQIIAHFLCQSLLQSFFMVSWTLGFCCFLCSISDLHSAVSLIFQEVSLYVRVEGKSILMRGISLRFFVLSFTLCNALWTFENNVQLIGNYRTFFFNLNFAYLWFKIGEYEFSLSQNQFKIGTTLLYTLKYPF